MPTTTVRVSLRGQPIAQDAVLEPRGERAFLAVARPAPVRSVLELREGDSVRWMTVVRTIESGDTRGVLGIVSETRPADRVGSEQFAAGDPEAIVAAAHADSGPEAASAYPVPAPVLDPEPSQPIDVRDDLGTDAGDGAEPDGDGEPAAGRGKKRKGRRRG
jgi:hypothetical protein